MKFFQKYGTILVVIAVLFITIYSVTRSFLAAITLTGVCILAAADTIFAPEPSPLEDDPQDK